MSLDTVKIDVNLTETSQVSEDAQGPFFDSLGALLWFEGGALWRIESGKTTKKKIAGGGSLWSNVVGDKMPIDQFGFLRDPSYCFGCEVEAGVYWCVRNNRPTALLEVDTKKGEVEVIFAQTADQAGTGGYFGSGVTRNGPKAVVNYPYGPIRCTIGPNGAQVYFYDYNKLRVADLRTKEVRTLDLTPLGLIHNPELLKPSKPMLLWSDIGSLQNGAQNQTSTSLSWILVSYSTRLVDLDTGAHATLFASMLHPLLALSSSMVLAVEVDRGAAWIVLVDWSLPSDLASSSTIVKSSESRYLLPKERIKRITQLSGNFRYWADSFLFDSSSNQLFCYSSSSQDITRYSNVFKIISAQDTNHVIFPSSIMSNRDLSKLLHPECPLPYDLQLTHSASNTSWNIHYDVLKHHEKLKTKKDVDRLATIVKKSCLPSASIFSFLKYLYFSSPADLTNAVESFMPLCHCIQLCNQVGLGTSYSNYILWLLETKIVPHLPNEILLQNILTLWLVEQDPAPESIATYSKTSPLMSLLASRCRKYASDAEIQQSAYKFEFSKTTLLLPQIVELCSSFSLFLSSGSSSPLAKLELLPSAPSVCMEMQLPVWDEDLSDASPAADKHTFVFTIEGRKTGGIVCKDVLLYTQWQWFERLCKAENCEEVRTRRVVMPSGMTPASLLAIVSSCYGTDASNLHLSTVDMGVIVLKSGEFQLTESPCLAELVEYCRKTLYSAVTDRNCLEKLHEFWTAGFGLDHPLFVDTIKRVFKNWHNLTFNDLSKLPMRLCILIGACLGDKSQATEEDFASLATLLDQSVESLKDMP